MLLGTPKYQIPVSMISRKLKKWPKKLFFLTIFKNFQMWTGASLRCSRRSGKLEYPSYCLHAQLKVFTHSRHIIRSWGNRKISQNSAGLLDSKNSRVFGQKCGLAEFSAPQNRPFGVGWSKKFFIRLQRSLENFFMVPNPFLDCVGLLESKNCGF